MTARAARAYFFKFAEVFRIVSARSDLPYRLAAFARLVAARFGEDRCGSIAQALSFTTVLALVPLTTVAFGFISVFPVFERWMATVQTFVYSHFVAAAGDVVQHYIQQYTAKAGRLTALGFAFLIVTSLMLMANIERTFNLIWRATRARRFVHRFVTYWAVLTLGPILIAVSLSLSSYLFAFAGHGVRRAVLWVLPVLIELFAFALLYSAVPSVPVRWRHALIGAGAAALLFEIAKRGFAFFMIHYSSYKTVYGAVATLPVFLLWIYVSWTIILLGALVTAALPQWKALGVARAPGNVTGGERS